MAGPGRPKGLPRTGGRQKGTINKTTASVKEALTQAFEQMGGVPALLTWGRSSPDEFYKLWAKMLPTEITANVNATVQYVVYAVPEAKDATNWISSPDVANSLKTVQ